MKKLLFLCLLTFSACTQKDGVQETQTGWDVTKEGKTYRYRCEPDGFYLYIDWNGEKNYNVGLVHEMSDKSFTDVTDVSLKFLCVNKDGDNVYLADYSDFNSEKSILGFLCNTDADGGLYILKSEIPESYKLFEKYINR